MIQIQLIMFHNLHLQTICCKIVYHLESWCWWASKTSRTSSPANWHEGNQWWQSKIRINCTLVLCWKCQTISKDNSMIHHDNSIPTGIDYLGKHRAYFLREKRSSTSLGSRMKKIELQQHVIWRKAEYSIRTGKAAIARNTKKVGTKSENINYN
jgi:hypothetical protein